MDSKTYSAIVKTVCYNDIFDYPLHELEVRQWIIGVKKAPTLSQIKEANGILHHKNGFVFLEGKEELIEKRIKRSKIAEKKLAIAKKAAQILSSLPSILLIGISGSLARRNTEKNDDIDFFIVTKNDTLWISRFFAVLLTSLFFKRRTPFLRDVTNTICLNMFVEEQALCFQKNKQNLYTAFEISQLRILYNKDQTYEKMLAKNQWIKDFLPFATPQPKKSFKKLKPVSKFIKLSNKVMSYPQILYMQRHRTTEVISKSILFFHPNDYSKEIMDTYLNKTSHYDKKV